ncbi:MAG: nitrogen fixation/metabolism regulation signal transduction histidine kinase, partial [Alphaproteobacteria bacterium]
MGFNTFSALIGLRTVLIMLTLLGLTYLTFMPGYHAATIVLTLVLIFECYSMVKFIARTNAELVRFLDAARYADYSQRFELKGLGAGFSELGEAFADILERFQNNRQKQEEQFRHVKAVVEHLPVPLISIKQNGTLKLWNNAARRLFGSSRIVTVNDLEQFGSDFVYNLTNIKAGERRLVSFQVDNMAHQLSVSMTDIIVGREQEKLLSLQDIQNELDANQLQSWQDLVRVLTHEIMNSITPVASLSKTAVDLVQDTKEHVKNQPDVLEHLNDIASAVQTVARRSDGLMKFVGSYRKLTRLPAPKKVKLKVADCFAQVIEIIKQGDQKRDIEFKVKIEPSELEMSADPSMLEHILINLVKNAQQALHLTESPTITMQAEINRRGHVVFEIADNGPGIGEDVKSKIFVPFFTTKKRRFWCG